MIPAQVYPAGAELFRQGDSAQEVYFIDSGIIKLVCLNEDGGQTIVGLRSRGSILGAAAVMVNKPHSLSAVTLSNCGARCFPAAGFRHLLQTDAEFTRLCFQSHSLEYYEQVANIARLAGVPAQYRFEHLLRQLMRMLELKETQKPLRLKLPLTYEETGALIGVCSTYVCKLMGKLERDGKIKRDKGWLIIPDPQKLRYQDGR